MWEIREISLDTPLAQLGEPALVELDAGRAIVLPPHVPRPTIRKPQKAWTASPHGYGIIYQGDQGVADLGWAAGDRSISDVVEAHRGFEVRRAFALPPGQVVLGVPPAYARARRVLTWGGGLAAAIGVFAGYTHYRAVGAPWGMHIATFALVVALLGIALLMLMLFPSSGPGYESQGRRLPVGEIALPRGLGEVAQRQVDDIKERYGQLLSDLAYRIEYPALFDAACPLTEELTMALFEWDSTAARIDSTARDQVRDAIAGRRIRCLPGRRQP